MQFLCVSVSVRDSSTPQNCTHNSVPLIEIKIDENSQLFRVTSFNTNHILQRSNYSEKFIQFEAQGWVLVLCPAAEPEHASKASVCWVESFEQQHDRLL